MNLQSKILTEQLLANKKIGNLIWEFDAKKKLIGELGREAGFEFFQELVGRSGGSLHYKRIASQYEETRTDARGGSSSFVKLSNGGKKFQIPLAHILGPGNNNKITGVSRSLYVASLKGASVYGRSSFVGWNGKLLQDFEAHEVATVDDQMQLDPILFDVDQHGGWFIEEQPAAFELELDQAFSLIGCYTRNFGHWMWQYLPKYVMAVENANLEGVPILIDAGMPPTHREVLEMIAADDAPIIEVPRQGVVRLKRLWTAATVYYAPCVSET